MTLRPYNAIHASAWALLCLSALFLFFVIPTYGSHHAYSSPMVVFLNFYLWPAAVVFLILAPLLFLWSVLRGFRAGILGLALSVLAILMI